MTGSGRPTRTTVAGRVHLNLQKLARSQHRPTDELQQLYALEGFLVRLATSRHADKLVLKGGVLLAAYDARRPTRDIDIQACAIAGDRDNLLGLVREIANIAVDTVWTSIRTQRRRRASERRTTTAVCGSR